MSEERPPEPVEPHSQKTSAYAGLSSDVTSWYSQTFGRLIRNIDEAGLLSRHTVEDALACLLAGGHLLIHDRPGNGGQPLVDSLFGSIQGERSRIGLSRDIVPSDMLGVTMYDAKNDSWNFHKGPIFASMVHVKDLERAGDASLLALLDVMDEHSVSVDGLRHPIATPFFVAASHRLPIPRESLLWWHPDAFMIKVVVDSIPADGYLKSLLRLIERGETSWRSDARPIITSKAIVDMQQILRGMEIPGDVARLVARIGEASARNADVRTGFSLRALTDLLRASAVLAASRGAGEVSTSEIIRLYRPVLTHRIMLTEGAVNSGVSEELVLDEIFRAAMSDIARCDLGRAPAASRQQRANLQKALLRRLHRSSMRVLVEELVDALSHGSAMAGLTTEGSVYEAITSLVEWGMVELEQVNGVGEGNELTITLFGREAMEDHRTPFEFYSSRSVAAFEWRTRPGERKPHIWRRMPEPSERIGGSDSVSSIEP